MPKYDDEREEEGHEVRFSTKEVFNQKGEAEEGILDDNRKPTTLTVGAAEDDYDDDAYLHQGKDAADFLDDVSFMRGRCQIPPKKMVGLLLLAFLLVLMLIGVVLRLAMSQKDSLKTDPRKGITREQEADHCHAQGCSNWDCLRIGECHTDLGACDDCIVDGRPFREGLSSKPLLAQTTVSCGDCPWSTTRSEHSQTQDVNTVTTWSERAVGEHASIASFAAFTIALLTHAAPPDLVADALQAATDELRHAQLTFGRAAAANGGVGVGPTALPQSRLEFSQDLTALAQAVAQEGCIDETLSALFLAQQSEQEIEDKKLLWSIAQDEARHSLLAWRTLLWVCDQDSAACRTTMQTTLHPDRVAKAVQSRWGFQPEFSSLIQPLQDAWQRLAVHLIQSTKEGLRACPTYIPSSSAVDTLSMDIIGGFCRPVMVA